LKHIDKLNNLIEKNKLKCNKLENENKELEKETKELIDQTEELENDIENNKEKTRIRVEKLRDICKKRNKTIKIQKKLLIIIIVHLLIISYIGFIQYYYTLLYSVVGIFNVLTILYYNVVIIGQTILYNIKYLTLFTTENIPMLYDSSYGFYILYSSMIYDIYNSFIIQSLCIWASSEILLKVLLVLFHKINKIKKKIQIQTIIIIIICYNIVIIQLTCVIFNITR